MSSAKLCTYLITLGKSLVVGKNNRSDYSYLNETLQIVQALSLEASVLRSHFKSIDHRYEGLVKIQWFIIRCYNKKISNVWVFVLLHILAFMKSHVSYCSRIVNYADNDGEQHQTWHLLSKNILIDKKTNENNIFFNITHPWQSGNNMRIFWYLSFF